MNILVKIIFCLCCFGHQLLITEQLIYGINDLDGTKIFSIHLNGTDKPKNCSFIFRIDYEKGDNIESLECTGSKYLISINNHLKNSKLLQFSSNGVKTFSEEMVNDPQVKIRHDWLTGNLYLASWDRIMVAFLEENLNLTNLKRSVVLESVDTKVTDLALNPNSGIMYFSTHDGIMQANMDGSEMHQFVHDSRPEALAIDLVSEGDERLYWIDVSKKTIESIKLDGRGRFVIAQKEKYDVSSSSNLIIYKDQLIYMDNEEKFKSINKYNGEGVWTWESPELRWRYENVKYFTTCDEGNQPIRKRNPCRDSKCSYLCVVSGGYNSGFECLCPDGKFLNLDGLTCIESSLAMASKNTIKLFRLDLIATGEVETITIPEIKSIKSFCYNPKNYAFIFYDSILKKIFEYNRITKVTMLLVGSQIGNVEAVGLDAISQNLYWIDSQRQTLEVMSLDTKARKVLRFHVVKYNNAEILLAHEPFAGLFTTGLDWIIAYSLEGSTSRIFSDVGNKPIGLTQEMLSNDFFWIEGTTGKIFFSRDFPHNKIVVTYPASDNTTERKQILGPVRDGVIHQGSVYWIPKNVDELHYTRIGSSNISKIGIVGFENAKLAILNKFFDHMRVSNGGNLCFWRNPKRKNCSHICAPYGESYERLKGECDCPDGFELGEDGLTCERQKECVEMPVQFRCNDGTCISGWFICDGIKDCGKSEDEVEELCLKWNPSQKLHVSGGESKGNWWMILSLVFGVILAVGAGLALYRKFDGDNNDSRSISVLFKKEGSLEDLH